MPQSANVIDLAQLVATLDWENVSAMEQAVLFGEVVDLGQLISEVETEPEYALLSWDDGLTLLHISALYNYLNLASVLIGHGANVNAYSQSRGVPLHAATDHNHFEIVRLLVDNGANVNALDLFHRTALHYAVLHNNYDIVCYLLSHSADASIEDKFGLTALDWAKTNCFHTIIDELKSTL